MKAPRFCKLADDELSVYFRALWQPHTWFELLFFSVWLTFWTGGCAMLLREALAGEMFLWLFGIPFWAAEIFVAGFILNKLLFRVRFTLNREGLTYREWGIFPKKHTIPWENLKRFRIGKTGDSRNRDSFLVLVLKDGEEIPLKGFAHLKSTSAIADWIEENGNEFIKNSYDSIACEPTKDFDPEEYEDDPEEYEDDPEDDTFEEAYPADGRYSFIPQPDKSEWVRSEEYSPFEVAQTKRFCWQTMLSTLFVCLFWNGIVSVFVLTLWGVMPVNNQPEFLSGSWWLLFVFLLPFEFIGLVIFFGFLGALFPSCVRQTLIFERGEILRRSSYFGFRFSRKFSVEDVSRYVIFRDAKSDRCKIQFLNKYSNVLCKIDDLTLFDAQWLLSEYRQIAGR